MSAQEPTGDLVRRLIADLSALAVAYRRATSAHLHGLGRDVAVAALLIGAALVVGIFALGLAVAALVLVVAIWLPGWLAALVVLGVTVISMGVMVAVGVTRVRRRRAAWTAAVAEEIRWVRSLFPRES